MIMALLLLPVSLAQVYYSDGNYYTDTSDNGVTSNRYPYSESRYYNDATAQYSGQSYVRYDPYWTYNGYYGTDSRYGTNSESGSISNPFQTTRYTSEVMTPTKSNAYTDTYRQLNMVNNQHTVNQVTPVNRIHEATTYRTTKTSSTQIMPGRTETVQTN